MMYLIIQSIELSKEALCGHHQSVLAGSRKMAELILPTPSQQKVPQWFLYLVGKVLNGFSLISQLFWPNKSYKEFNKQSCKHVHPSNKNANMHYTLLS
jgi:hypothetical protein